MKRTDQTPNFPEAVLSPIATSWLEQQGFEVYAEAPLYGTSIDLVGIRWSDTEIIAIELKTNLSHKVISQAHINQLVTKESYAGIPTSPTAKSLAVAFKVGVGVIRLNKSTKVILEPCTSHRALNRFCRERLLDYCRRSEPGGVGGLPVLKGRGPAQECHAAVMAYTAENPTASWCELFEAIPNHYAHPLSFRSSMHQLELWKKVTDRIGRRSLRAKPVAAVGAA